MSVKRKITVEVGDGHQPSPLRAAAEQLAKVTSAPKLAQDAEVEAARKSLAPTVQRANELYKEMSELSEEYEDDLRALARTDWTALRRYRVPEEVITRLHRLIREATESLTLSRSTLAEISARVRDLTARDLQLHIFPPLPFQSAGRYPAGVTHIKADVHALEGAPAHIREVVAEIEHLLGQIMRTIARSGGEPVAVVATIHRLDPPKQTEANSAFDVFARQEEVA